MRHSPSENVDGWQGQGLCEKPAKSAPFLSNRPGSNCSAAESDRRELSNPGDLYFVRVGAFLKIGRTRNLQERLRIIRCHSPTEPELVGSIAGAGSMEKTWHYAFRKILSRGEWFKIGPALKETVDAALRGEDWMHTVGPQWWRDDVNAYDAERFPLPSHQEGTSNG